MPVGLIRDLFHLIPLALVAIAIGAAFNAVRKPPLPWGYQAVDERLARGVASSPLIPAGEVVDRDVTEALKAWEEKHTVFVDARAEAFFHLGRIPGAINLPPSSFREKYPEFVGLVKPTQPVLVYCSGVDCSDGLTVARALRRLGYFKTAVFGGGWEEWEAAELPREP